MHDWIVKQVCTVSKRWVEKNQRKCSLSRTSRFSDEGINPLYNIVRKKEIKVAYYIAQHSKVIKVERK